MVFRHTLPVKPSVTKMSNLAGRMSQPSPLPAKLGTCSRRSACASWANAEPFASSSPMLSKATRGFATPTTFSMYTVAICANCTRYAGLQSAFAPMSVSTTGRTGDGMTVASAGRDTPRTRPMTSVAAARHAPVEPAEKNPCAAPSFTRRHPTTMDESFLRRTALAGCSPMEMTSSAGCAVQRSCATENGPTTSAGPQRTTCRSGSAASAAAQPSSTTPGAPSPPMASTAMITLSGIPNLTLAKGRRETLRCLIPPSGARRLAGLGAKRRARGQDRAPQSLAASACAVARRRSLPKSLPARRAARAMCGEACQRADAEEPRGSAASRSRRLRGSCRSRSSGTRGAGA